MKSDTPIKIVVGMGAGDEGKGKTVSHLCSKEISESRPCLVVRFNGGHQAGHTVVFEGKRHVFSNFGSGTLQGIPTYWSKFCTVSPVGLMREYKLLKDRFNLIPEIVFHPMCPVVTPWDMLANIRNTSNIQHGTCGVGYGTTLQRQEDHYNLYLRDLYYPKICNAKLNNIKHYYLPKLNYLDQDIPNFMYKELELYMEALDFFRITFPFKNQKSFDLNSTLIFEGAQGILLDQDLGFFPNVTRSNTTCKNVLSILDSIINKTNLSEIGIELYYVTRTYQTRHGNGYMSSFMEYDELDETNKSGRFLGKLKKGAFDFTLINYALECNNFILETWQYKQLLRKQHLVLTHVDRGLTSYIEHNSDIVKSFSGISILGFLKAHGLVFDRYWQSFGPETQNIKPLT